MTSGVAFPDPSSDVSMGVCGEPRNACGLPCEPCEGKPDPEWVPVASPAHGVALLVTDHAVKGWYAALADARLAARKAGNDWLVCKLDEIHQRLLATDGVRVCDEGECRAAERDSIICAGECDVAAGRRPDGVALPQGGSDGR